MTETPSSGRSFVFIQPHLKFGGAESQTVAIINGLVARGHSCRLVLHSKLGGLLENVDPRVKVVSLGFESHLNILTGAIRARGVLRSFPQSTVVVRLWSSIMLVALARSRKDRHLYAFVEDLDPRDHGRFIRFGRLKQSLIGKIFRRHEPSLVANTRHVAEAMQATYKLKATPAVIECGIESEAIRRSSISTLPAQATRDTPRERLRFVTVGSLIQRKGLSYLIERLAELDEMVEWTIVGEGPMRDWLQEQSTRFAHVHIHIVGGTTNPYPYIADADVMLHSALSESFGVVLIEALALGTPVIAHGANGPKEIAQQFDETRIRLFDVRAKNSLRHALRTAPVVDVGSHNNRDALGPYELDAVIEKWESFGQ